MSRLDYCLIPMANYQNVKECEIVPVSFTDHSTVKVVLEVDADI